MTVLVDACEELERDSILRLLRIEMADRLSSDSSEIAVEVAVQCRNSAVLIRVSNSTSRGFQRALSFSEARGQVGARVVALKSVELLREWDNRAVPTAPTPTPVETVPAVEADFRVFLAAELLSVGFQSPFLGGELSFEYAGWRPFFGRLGLGYLSTRRSYDEGSATGRLLSGRAEVGLRDEMDWFAWGGGIGYRLGDALLQGEGTVPGQAAGEVHGLWGGAVGELFVEVRGDDHFVAKLSGEAGVPVHQVSGTISGHADLALDQSWLSLSLGVGAHW